MQRSWIQVIFLLFFIFSFTGETFCLEPLTSLDDGFSIPGDGSMEEASLLFPGSESLIERPYAVLGYSVPFGLEDLAVSSFIAGSRFGKTGISLSWNGSGGDLYSDEQEKLGISYHLSKSIHLGARLTRNALHIQGFGRASAWSGDAGMIFHPADSFYLAVSYEDVAGAELGESKEPLDGRSRAAVSWNLPGEVTLIGSFTKVRRFDPSCSGGCVLGIGETLNFGIAGANEPNRIEFLSSIMVRNLKFSYRGSFLGDLGFTHGFSIGLGGGKGK